MVRASCERVVKRLLAAPEHPLTARVSLIDDVLETFRAAVGRDLPGYRAHAYRVFHFAQALAGHAADPRLLAAACAFHDLGIWSDGTFDYLEPSAARAVAYLSEREPSIDARAVEELIELHHKLTPCAPSAGVVAEAFRRADLVDLSFGIVTFGLPFEFVREVRTAFPNAGFHRGLLRHAAAWTVRHPARPLPMLRW